MPAVSWLDGSGSLAWTMFSEIVVRSQTMFLENANLLKKSSFPRSCVPAIIGSSALASFAIVYSVFLALLALSARWPGIVVVAALVPLLLLAFLGLAAGVFLGVVHVFFRDVGHVLAIALQVWFWLTPIVYPVHILPPSYAKWIGINPVTPIVQALQTWVAVHPRDAMAWQLLSYGGEGSQCSRDCARIELFWASRSWPSVCWSL